MKRAVVVTLVVAILITIWWTTRSKHQGPDTPAPELASVNPDALETKRGIESDSTTLPPKSLQEQQIRALRAGATFDDQASYGYALDICNSRKPIAGPSTSESHEFFYAFQRSYCSGVPAYQDNSWTVDALLERRAKDGDPEAVTLREATAAAYHDGMLDNPERMREELRQILEKTNSATAFMKAGQLLSEPEVFGSDGWEQGRGSSLTLSADQIQSARMFGVLFAACSEFDICGNQSLYPVRACMPDQCTRGFSVEGYARRRLSGDELEESKRYAKTLLDTYRR